MLKLLYPFLSLLLLLALQACQTEVVDCAQNPSIFLIDTLVKSRTSLAVVQDNPKGMRVTLHRSEDMPIQGNCPLYNIQTLSVDYTHHQVKGKGKLIFRNDALLEFRFIPENYEAYIVALCDKGGICVDDTKYILHKGVRVGIVADSSSRKEVVFIDDCFQSQIDADTKKCL